MVLLCSCALCYPWWSLWLKIQREAYRSRKFTKHHCVTLCLRVSVVQRLSKEVDRIDHRTNDGNEISEGSIPSHPLRRKHSTTGHCGKATYQCTYQARHQDEQDGRATQR